MKTECNTRQLGFQGAGRRGMVGKFDGGTITSDAGGLLLREVDDRLGISKRCAKCFADYRNEKSIEHEVEALVRQRIYGLALGYEDLNDHDDLRSDPLLAVLCEKKDATGSKRKNPRDRGKALAGKSTLNRMELTEEEADKKNRYKKNQVQCRKGR